MDKNKFDMMMTGDVPIIITTKETDSLSFAIGTLKNKLEEIKNDDSYKNEISNVILNLKSIRDKYMNSKYE